MNNNIKELKLEANDYPSWILSDRQICDLELILNGGFQPLCGFLTKDDYDSVVDKMRLKNGDLWPLLHQLNRCLFFRIIQTP